MLDIDTIELIRKISLMRFRDEGALIFAIQDKNHSALKIGENNKIPFDNMRFRVWIFSYVMLAIINIREDVIPCASIRMDPKNPEYSWEAMPTIKRAICLTDE